MRTAHQCAVLVGVGVAGVALGAVGGESVDGVGLLAKNRMSRPGGVAAMSANVRLCLIPVLAGLLAGCAAVAPRDVDWPASLPPKAYYESLYERDEVNRAVQTLDDYLLWVVRFYKGWAVYPFGWESRRDELLRGVSDARYAIVRAKLSYVGRLVSSEWSKRSPERTVFNDTLAAWGQAATEAVERGEQERLVDRVTGDVEALLDGMLGSEEIVPERYYPELADG